MKLNTMSRSPLCHSCGQIKPASQMIHAYGRRLYCSEGCVARAQWLIETIPDRTSPRA
jgi:hypothetical protein